MQQNPLLSILDNFVQHKEIDDSTGININSTCISLYGKASRNIHAIQVAMGDIRIEETLPGQPAGESHLAFSGMSDPLAHQIEVIRERIYHEDSLLGTRSYNLLTTQAFLVTALAATISGQVARHQRQITLLIAILGLSMGLMYGVVTIGTLSSITFWRDKLREMEGLVTIQPWIPFDANLEETRAGQAVPIQYGLLRISGINRLLSWIVPLLLFSFWIAAIVWIWCSVR